MASALREGPGIVADVEPTRLGVIPISIEQPTDGEGEGTKLEAVSSLSCLFEKSMYARMKTDGTETVNQVSFR